MIVHERKIPDIIFEGFRIINKNWQLLFVQVGVILLNVLAFIVFVGIPVVAALSYLGIDYNMLKELISSPLSFLRKSIFMAAVIALSFIFYIVVASAIGLFAIGGNISTIKYFLDNAEERFSLKRYIDGGWRYFFPLCWLTLIMGSFFLLFLFIIGVIGGVGAAFYTNYKETLSTVSLFITFFAGLLSLAGLITGLLGFLMLYMFSIVAMFAEGRKAWEAIKRGYAFLLDNPLRSLGFYLIVILGYFCALVLLFMVINISADTVTVNLPLQLITNIVQIYLGLGVMASIVVFYLCYRRD